MFNDTPMWVPGKSLEQLEKEVILKAYNFCNKNKLRTAESLGISPRTLDNKFERYSEQEKIELELFQRRTKRNEIQQYKQRGMPVPSHLLDEVEVKPAEIISTEQTTKIKKK
jgi:hypothetical protein